MSNEQQSSSQNSMYNPEVNYFGLTNYRNQFRKFGIKTDDRRRHMYVIGKTGMGKTTILENMVLNDIYAGHGIGLVDPHGDFAEKVLNYVPPHRINDIVYFNPSDLDFPVGFNILESVNEEYRHLVASGLMGVFKKIWPDVWSARMEYILNNTILALIGYPDTTLLGINRLLSDDDYRSKVIAAVKDPVVKAFWDVEFASYSDKYKQEAVAPIQNKIGQFLSASIIRNIVAQVKSTINIREIMDSRKIFIMNLSKGRIGEDSSRLLGGMLITKIQLSAMERVDTPEKERKDFFLYVDEFQNFATESFSNILSEARKYRLDLIMAHQYMEQLDEGVRAAVIGNVGTMVMFRVGSTDADILVKEFAPTFTEEDLVNLPKFHVYLKLMIDGVASRPFSALTLPPIAAATGSLEKVLRVSRERYGTPRATIEEKIAKWSGVFDQKEAAPAGGSGQKSVGFSKNGGGKGGSKPLGGFKNSSGNPSKGKPMPPRSSPPPKAVPTNPPREINPINQSETQQEAVSLKQMAPPTKPANVVEEQRSNSSREVSQGNKSQVSNDLSSEPPKVTVQSSTPTPVNNKSASSSQNQSEPSLSVSSNKNQGEKNMPPSTSAPSVRQPDTKSQPASSSKSVPHPQPTQSKNSERQPKKNQSHDQKFSKQNSVQQNQSVSLKTLRNSTLPHQQNQMMQNSVQKNSLEQRMKNPSDNSQKNVLSSIKKEEISPITDSKAVSFNVPPQQTNNAAVLVNQQPQDSSKKKTDIQPVLNHQQIVLPKPESNEQTGDNSGSKTLKPGEVGHL
jgi:hypothetical protein